MTSYLNGRGDTTQPVEKTAAAIESLEADWSFVTHDFLDSLPQVWTRGFLYFLMIFVTIALPWALFSKVEQTGSARGRLEPKGNTIRLDAEVVGTVAEIKFQEGEIVEANQPLVILESAITESELQKVEEQLRGQTNQLAQLRLLKNQLAIALAVQEQQNQAQILEKQAQVDQATQAVAQAHSNEKLTAVSLGNAQREVERYDALVQTGAVPEIQLAEKQDLSLQQQQLHIQSQDDIEQSHLRLEEQKRGYQSLLHSGKLAKLSVDEQLKELDAQVLSAEADIVQSQQEIEILKLELNQRIIKAPVNGIIFDAPIKQAGVVVQSGTKLAEISPDGADLMIRAQMATTDSGELTEGLPVKLKFDAYPFQDYGVLAGRLIQISPTSDVTETEQGEVATYELEIEPEQDCIATAGGCIALRPGDTATAEVVIRERRIIDIIFDPFKKLQKGGLRL